MEYTAQKYDEYAPQALSQEELTAKARQALADAFEVASKSSSFETSEIDQGRVERAEAIGSATLASLGTTEAATVPEREYDPFNIPDLLLVGKHIERLRLLAQQDFELAA